MPDIATRTLPNGLSVLVEKNLGVRSCGLACLLPAGAGRDEPGLDGRAAVTAELLLRGAGELDSRAQADAFDLLGVSRSAGAGVRFMSVSASMLAERLPEAVPLIAAMIRRPRFEEPAVPPAKELALQSIEALADDPQRRAVLGARARHFADPFSRTGLGTREGIAALTRDALASGWAHDAVPAGSILAVAGAVDPGVVFDEVERAFGEWAGETTELVPTGEPERGYAHEHDDAAQVQIILVHDAPPEPSRDSVLERLAVGVLSGGMSARLFTEVREKRGLCYAVHASYRAERDFGVVTASVGTTPQRAQESLDVLVSELHRINAEGIEPDEFARAVTRLKSNLVFSGESTSARAGALASDQHKLGRPRTLDEVAARVDAVTLDEVNAYLAARSLGRVTIQTLGPGELTPPATA